MTQTCPRGHAVVGDNALRRNHLGKKWVECRACKNTANRDCRALGIRIARSYKRKRAS